MMFTYQITSLDGNTILCNINTNTSTIQNLKKEISLLTSNKYNTICIWSKEEELSNTDIVEYTTKLYLLIDIKQSFTTKEELKEAILQYNSPEIIKKYGNISYFFIII